MYPKIYIAIDNCFAYKRWTRPDDWSRIISDIGLKYIEASADTELDPLYMGRMYLNDWVYEVKEAECKYDVKVCNLYSGHSTYTTIGLTHTDERVRRRLIDDWFKPMLEIAGKLNIGMGFFAHGFPHHVLQNQHKYNEYIKRLEDGLVEINTYANRCGCREISIEQMYSPQHYPWTINNTRHLISNITQKSGRNFYFTEDVGHYNTKFLRPDKAVIENLIGNIPKDIWLGTDEAYRLAQDTTVSTEDTVNKIMRNMDENPNLFSELKDTNCYTWLEELGCYSPIIHLQQTLGRESLHLPFTNDVNKKGIITGDRVLRALKKSYEKPDESKMPSKCKEIYLTMEIFSKALTITHDLINDICDSVEYWRKWVPEDGMYLDQLI